MAKMNKLALEYDAKYAAWLKEEEKHNPSRLAADRNEQVFNDMIMLHVNPLFRQGMAEIYFMNHTFGYDSCLTPNKGEKP